MRALVLDRPREPLRLVERPRPEPGPGQVRLRVRACGVCRTDLHVVDGELPDLGRPVVPGHQVVGVVDAAGPGAVRLATGQRVGVPWLGWTCGACRFCLSGRENLCTQARFTGYHLDGGFAEAVVADERFCFPLPEGYGDVGSGAAALRGTHRLPRAVDGRGRRAAGALRLRRRRPHRRAGRAPPGPARVRVHATGRRDRRGSSPSRSARGGPGPPTLLLPSRSTRRSCSRPRASSSPPRCVPSTAAAPWSAPAST